MIAAYELVAAVLLLLWVIFVTLILTRRLFVWMKSRGVEDNVGVYYNRKVIHIFAGGVCASAVPYLFSTSFFPLVMSILLSIFTYIPHKTGRLMYWFQTTENMYEVTFTMMWGIVITLGWLLSGGDFLIGVLPVLFMSVGDAVTGIVRNHLYRKRTKSWWGNVAMAAFSMTVGAMLGFAGIAAGGVASVVEHFEFYSIDDNVTVPSFSFAILLLSRFLAPWLLTF